MITNFEEITTGLSPEELFLVPLVCRGFEKYTKANPIKAPLIVAKMKVYLDKEQSNVSFSEPRLRKIVNYIRVNGLLPLIATSNGYYVTDDKVEIERQIQSLKERARSIDRCADGLMKYVN